MKTAFLAISAAVLGAASCASAQQSADPSGIWMRDDGNARVRIAACGKNICATNLWIGDTSKGEEAGDRLIMSLTQKSADTLTGTAYDEKRDRTYSITLTVSGNGLVTRGCILGGILCRDVGWSPAR